uniref:hypothetical protein n=1 Tax=Micromonospora echinaurantiaca TaxID=47857 RepID=UPI001E403D1C|nr:hypothetical protein [Micromonospora echinaurantiaca]
MYTHVSNEHSAFDTFDTQTIVARAPESHYVLDWLLGNERRAYRPSGTPPISAVPPRPSPPYVTWSANNAPRVPGTSKRSPRYRTGPKSAFGARYPWAGRC